MPVLLDQDWNNALDLRAVVSCCFISPHVPATGVTCLGHSFVETLVGLEWLVSRSRHINRINSSKSSSSNRL